MSEESGKVSYATNLQQITCILQRGNADKVVNAAIAAGAPAATIIFGRGTGIRQRLGLLKIAISPEKEVIEVIVTDKQEDAVFDAMVKAGNLDVPGMGIIYTTTVLKALVYQSKKED